MLRGVDRAAFASSLGLRLRHEGIAVPLRSIGVFVDALAAAAPDTRSRLNWLARITLVHHQDDLATFDIVFDAVFADAVLSLDPVARRQAAATVIADDRPKTVPGATSTGEQMSGLPWATLPNAAAPSGADADETDLALAERRPSDVEALADLPFAELTAPDRAMLGAWLETALVAWPTRRSRRSAPHPSGRRVALRSTLERSRRTGWEPVRLVRVRARPRPRRVVMLCDVSQSMQTYASAYLHLMRGAVLAADAEVFAFATSLTRLTVKLAHSSADAAVEAAAESVVDRFGGTRIATNVRALLASHHGEATRGSVVIIASDGWDSDPPDELGAVMERLHRRAHRVLWLNPRVSADGYAPMVGGMAAALPWCDELLPAHDLRALVDVAAAITRTTRSTGSTGTVATRGGRPLSSRA